MALGLSEGLRVGVVGAGPAGAAFAGALLAAARAFGRRIEVFLYDGGRERAVVPPALLDSDTRCRLASLGAVLPLRPTAVEVRGVLVHAGGRSALLETPAGGLWILDSPELPGERIVKKVLLDAAVLRGARLKMARVDAVERLDDEWVLRARGSSETFGLVAGAFGPDSRLAGSWQQGRFRPPPRLLGSHARIAWHGRDDLLRLCLAPTPEVDALVVVPCGAGAYVLAIGEDVEPAHLAAALAALVRDRALPGGLRIQRAERVALAAGATKRFADGASVTLGSAAFGNLLDPGLLPALVSATRSANAVLELGESGRLQHRLGVTELDLAAHARRQPRILHWARKAGARAPEALSGLVAHAKMPVTGYSILGMPLLPSGAVLSTMRWAAFKSGLEHAFAPALVTAPEPVAPSPLVYVVDDDPDTRAMLVEFLRARGSSAKAFDDELSLLEAAARERPGAILLDVVLRWVDGLSLCRALRNHPATRSARLISMSNLSRRADREAAIAAGADAFLAKPIDFDELDKLLVDLPKRREGEATGGERQILTR